ncbi:MAG: tyrosine-type recombinase/integrase [Pseudomonadota bacterium]
MTNDRRPLDEILREGTPAAPAIGERVLWDHVRRGLGLRLRAGSPSTWIYRRYVEGRLVKQTLARVDTMSLDQARAAAELIALGGTPGPAKVALREFAATFMRDCAGRWKPNTIKGHNRCLDRLILPTLGELAVGQIGDADVTAWLDQLDVAGRSKDRATSVLSSMMRHAETLGLRPAGSNPCAGRRRHRSDFEARYLTARDYRRLSLALDHANESDPVEVTCIRFLMLTGARRGEALDLEWSMVQGDRAALPDSKAGPKCLWFAMSVQQLLASLDRVETSPYVFVRFGGRGIASSLDRVWRDVRRHAGLDDLRLHDLRHSYASVAVGSGEELRTVAVLLGHSQMVTTLGYAHLVDQPVMAAAQRIDNHLAEAITPSDPVEPIRPESWMPKRSRHKCKDPSPSYLEAQARMAALHARVEPMLEAEPKCETKSDRASRKHRLVSEEDQRWTSHIYAWRKTKLKLPAFCHREGLDPAAMRRALARHFKRAKRERQEQRP